MTPSPRPKEEDIQGALEIGAGLGKWTAWVACPCERLTLPPSPRPQSISLVLLLLLLRPLGPAWHIAAQRCPQMCICDNPRRHVACRHQNFTEVPNAIPEVSRMRGAGRTTGGAWVGTSGSATAWLGDLSLSLFLSSLSLHICKME